MWTNQRKRNSRPKSTKGRKKGAFLDIGQDPIFWRPLGAVSESKMRIKKPSYREHRQIPIEN